MRIIVRLVAFACSTMWAWLRTIWCKMLLVIERDWSHVNRLTAEIANKDW